MSFAAAAAALAAGSLTKQLSEQLEAQQQHQQLQQLRQQLHMQSRHSAATNDSSMFYSPMQSEAGSVTSAAVEPLLSAGQSSTAAAAAGGYRRSFSGPAARHRLSNSADSKRLLSKLQRVTNDDGMGAAGFDEEQEQQQGQGRAAAAGETAAAGTAPGPTEALTTTAGNLARWGPCLCCFHALCVVCMRSILGCCLALTSHAIGAAVRFYILFL
jgi:hypothetical protein